jgi:hypothetical protein
MYLALLCQSILNTLLETMVYAALTLFVEVLIISLTLSYAQLMGTLSLKVPKAANLFEIWHNIFP